MSKRKGPPKETASDQPKGRGKGRPFPPGKSGNPAGRPKRGQSLAEAIRDEWTAEQIVQGMGGLARSAMSEQTRYHALNWLADRSHGKVPQVIKMQDGGVTGPYLADASDDDLERMIAEGDESADVGGR